MEIFLDNQITSSARTTNKYSNNHTISLNSLSDTEHNDVLPLPFCTHY